MILEVAKLLWDSDNSNYTFQKVIVFGRVQNLARDAHHQMSGQRINRHRRSYWHKETSVFSMSLSQLKLPNATQVFCNRLQWYTLEALILSFQKRLALGVRLELVPLMQIPGGEVWKSLKHVRSYWNILWMWQMKKVGVKTSVELLHPLFSFPLETLETGALLSTHKISKGRRLVSRQSMKCKAKTEQCRRHSECQFLDAIGIEYDRIGS